MENECPNDNGTDTALPNPSIDMTTEQEASNYKKQLIEFHELGARSDTYAPLVASRNTVAEVNWYRILKIVCYNNDTPLIRVRLKYQRHIR